MEILNNFKKIAIVLPLVLVFFTISCDNDDDAMASFDIAQLEASIAEAEDLIANSIEGTNAGDFQPGAKQSLQDVLNWIFKRIESSKGQDDINDALVKLNAAIDKFKVSIVEVALPWIRQEVGASISLSDNLNGLLGAGNFTLQGQFYIVNLNQAGFSNNVFATLDGPARGFSVRYFGDGSAQIVNGDGASFGVSQMPAGTFKSGEWLDIALTSSGKSLLTLYINGEVVSTLDKNFEQSSLPFWIGNTPAFPDRVANLLVRKFSIWDTALDQASIQANSDEDLDGTENNLEAYFPFGSDLGSSFVDTTGNYTATLNGNVTWESDVPVIVINYDNINAAIQELTDFRATVTEGNMDGDYPLGTIDYIDSLLSGADDVIANETRQTAIDETADSLRNAINIINENLVAPADGVYIDSENPSAVGFRTTPNYTPTGDYTYELDLKMKTLLLPSGFGDIFGNNTLGLRVNGYTELTEENLLNAGGGWNFTFIEEIGNYSGPMFPPLSIKSGVWQHIAIVHDDTAKTTAIYVDGEMVAMQEDIGVPLESVWAETWLGNAFGVKINGYIKDFRRWDEVRSVSQLDVDIDGSEPNLRTYFPLDRVKGIQFSDETGNYTGEMRGIIWNK